jgi:hypothetical protein
MCKHRRHSPAGSVLRPLDKLEAAHRADFGRPRQGGARIYRDTLSLGPSLLPLGRNLTTWSAHTYCTVCKGARARARALRARERAAP